MKNYFKSKYAVDEKLVAAASARGLKNTRQAVTGTILSNTSCLLTNLKCIRLSRHAAVDLHEDAAAPNPGVWLLTDALLDDATAEVADILEDAIENRAHGEDIGVARSLLGRLELVLDDLDRLSSVYFDGDRRFLDVVAVQLTEEQKRMC